MKITDENKTFTGESNLFQPPSLTVSSNRFGEHEMPSLCLRVQNDRSPFGESYGTNDIEQIKEIIQHMAKMAGLEVTFKDADALEVEDTVHVMGRDGIMTGSVFAINLSTDDQFPYLVEFEDGHREFYNRKELTKSV